MRLAVARQDGGVLVHQVLGKFGAVDCVIDLVEVVEHLCLFVREPADRLPVSHYHLCELDFKGRVIATPPCVTLFTISFTSSMLIFILITPYMLWLKPCQREVQQRGCEPIDTHFQIAVRHIRHHGAQVEAY